MGGSQSQEIDSRTPLGYILKYWRRVKRDKLDKKSLIHYCNEVWPSYNLGNGECWPKDGTIKYDTLVELSLYLRKEAKWTEVPYADLFFRLRQSAEYLLKCGVTAQQNSMVMVLEKEKQNEKDARRKCECAWRKMNQENDSSLEKNAEREEQEKLTDELLFPPVVPIPAPPPVAPTTAAPVTPTSASASPFAPSTPSVDLLISPPGTPTSATTVPATSSAAVSTAIDAQQAQQIPIVSVPSPPSIPSEQLPASSVSFFPISSPSSSISVLSVSLLVGWGETGMFGDVKSELSPMASHTGSQKRQGETSQVVLNQIVTPMNGDFVTAKATGLLKVKGGALSTETLSLALITTTSKTLLTPELAWFTFWDLKDEFFCLSLSAESQPVFTLEDENPDNERQTQQLAKDLKMWEHPTETAVVLQYVDDILLATETKEQCIMWTVSLLNILGLNGYQVSPQKAQIAQQQVIHLSYKITAGQRILGTARKETICQTSRTQQTFFSITGWCRLWTTSYGLWVKPPYELLKASTKYLIWDGGTDRAFHQLKQELKKAPALGLPNVHKPFWLFSFEKLRIALEVLAQNLGPDKRAVAYFSKQLDEVASGWLSCLRAVAAVVLNIQETRKFTLGQKITVLVSHTVSAVLEAKGRHWVSPQRFLRYQAILVRQDDVEIVVTNLVNPASFLSGATGEPVTHDCVETIESVCSSRLDLKETPLRDADDTWFTDGSSFIKQGQCMAGSAVTTADKVIEAKASPSNTSAQKAEITALTRVLELAAGMKINVWTDSKYSFGVVHAHGVIWTERGLLSSQGKTCKHAEVILKLVDAVQLPTKVAIIYCKAHQKGNSEQEIENPKAEQEVKRAAGEGVMEIQSLIPDSKLQIDQNEVPNYSKENQKLAEVLGMRVKPGEWVQGKVAFSCTLLWALVMAELPRKASAQVKRMSLLGKQQIVKLDQEAGLLRIQGELETKEELNSFRLCTIQAETSAGVGNEALAICIIYVQKQIFFRHDLGAQGKQSIPGAADFPSRNQDQRTSCVDPPHQSEESTPAEMKTCADGATETKAGLIKWTLIVVLFLYHKPAMTIAGNQNTHTQLTLNKTAALQGKISGLSKIMCIAVSTKCEVQITDTGLQSNQNQG